MRSPLRAGLVSALLCLTAAPLVAQQVPKWGSKGWELNAHVGLLNDEPEYDPDELGDQLRRDAIVGGRIGYMFGNGLFVDVEAQNSLLRSAFPTPTGTRVDNLNSWWFGGALGYAIQPSDPIQIFPVIGAGVVLWDTDGTESETNFSFNYGVGARYFVWNDLAVRGDLRMHQVPNPLEDTRAQFGAPAGADETMFLPELSIGVTYIIGGPKDSDGDGVYDRYDRCPDTPLGVVVDEFGCPIDSDGDGVFDGVDECPRTPAGATVDEKGCPSDSDGDRVLDGIDRCPDTPAGALVNAEGCPRDTDGDGFLDGIDRCPDTPPGVEVDEFGCSEIQAGIEEGLLVLQNIYFDFDKATIRPESEPILDQVGRALLQREDVRFEIQGHTDAIGTEQYNQELSRERAQAVLDWLLSRFPALDPDRLTAVGYGESRPIASNDLPEGRQENRRVEFHEIP